MSVMTTEQIVRMAQQHAEQANGDEEALFAAMGTIGNDAPAYGFTVTRARISFDAAKMAQRGRKLFGKFKLLLKKAVCDDFQYCSKRDDVDQYLKKYLPKIVDAVKKRIPISGKLPGWLNTILKLFGIESASVGLLITFLVAWLMINGCNALCGCKTK